MKAILTVLLKYAALVYAAQVLHAEAEKILDPITDPLRQRFLDKLRGHQADEPSGEQADDDTALVETVVHHPPAEPGHTPVTHVSDDGGTTWTVSDDPDVAVALADGPWPA